MGTLGLLSYILTLVVVSVATWWIWDMWMNGRLGFLSKEEEGADAP